MVQIGSVGGALIAFIACDKIGMPATDNAHYMHQSKLIDFE